MATRATTELCSSLDIHCLILEGDSLEVVQALWQEGWHRGSFGQLINDVRTLLSRDLTWQVNHVQWTANGAAHHLAKLGLNQNVSLAWRLFPVCRML